MRQRAGDGHIRDTAMGQMGEQEAEGYRGSWSHPGRVGRLRGQTGGGSLVRRTWHWVMEDKVKQPGQLWGGRGWA